MLRRLTTLTDSLPRVPQVGSVCVIAAMVNRTFRTSMEVGVRVEEEDGKTGARHHCCR